MFQVNPVKLEQNFRQRPSQIVVRNRLFDRSTRYMSEVLNRPARDPFSTRYSLLSRLQDWNDQESWMDFFESYWRLIYSVAIKAGLTEEEAQDVIQETVLSVAKSIHKFKRDQSLGSFKGWLRNIIRWRIADKLKKRLPVHAEEE